VSFERSADLSQLCTAPVVKEGYDLIKDLKGAMDADYEL
jgi:hypothetical protein